MAQDKKAQVREMIDELVSSGTDISATAIDADEMLEVMNHPKAADTIHEIMTQEDGSAQQGDDAPDFTLKPLKDFEGAAPVRLSEHFGKRPVALIFGSYT